MIRFALKSLAGRKLRTVLTALAIVLGVAMMSGAYVLTDTIDKAFDAIFVDSYAGTDAVVTGKDPGFGFEGESAEAPPIPEQTLERVREVDGVEVATGSVQDFRTKLLRPDGEAIDTGGAPSFAFGIETAPEYDRFNPLNLVEGRWPSGGAEVAIDEGVAGDEEPRARRPDRGRRARAGAGVRDRRHRQVRRPELDRRRHVRDLRRADGAEAAEQGRPARRGSGRGGGRHDARAAGAANQLGARRRRHRANGRRAGGRAVERDRHLHDDHPLLPALVRRDRALRRRVRHLQHALDHGRAADAGVRHPAHARRVAAAGAEVGDPRGARDRPRRLDRRPVQRPRPRRRAERALQGAEPRPAADRDGLRDAHDRRLAARRDARDADGRSLPGDPRDQGAADRRGSRGRDDAARTLRALHAVHRGGDRGARGRSRSPTEHSPTRLRPATVSPCSASAFSRCSSGSRCSRRGSSVRSRESWASLPGVWAARPARSPSGTRSATRAARPRPRPR